MKQWAFRLIEHWAQISSLVPADEVIPLNDINTTNTYRMLQGLASAIVGLLPTAAPSCIIYQPTPIFGTGPVTNGALSYTTSHPTLTGSNGVAPPSPARMSASLQHTAAPSGAYPTSPTYAPPPPPQATVLYHAPPPSHPVGPAPHRMNAALQDTAAHTRAWAEAIRNPAHPLPSYPPQAGISSAPPATPTTIRFVVGGRDSPHAALLAEPSSVGPRATSAKTRNHRSPSEPYALALKGTSINVEQSEDPFWTVSDADPLAWIVLPASQLTGIELTGSVKPGTCTVLRCYRHSRTPFQSSRRATPHEWPPELQIRITNTHTRSLLDMVKIRRSEKYKHYKDSYLDLSTHIQPGQTWFKVSFESPRPIQSPFFICAQALHPVSVDQLIETLRARTVSVENSKKFIQESFSRNDMVSFEKITLKDPQTLSRIEIPARGQECTHWGCFDLNVYLSANRNIRTWLCPRCNRPLPFEMLVIDAYFEEALRMFPDEDEIILNADATLTTKSRDKAPSTAASTESTTSKANDAKTVIVIDLDSDSDDDAPLPPQAAASHAAPNNPNPTLKTSQQLNIGASASAGRSYGSNGLEFRPTAAPSLPQRSNLEPRSAHAPIFPKGHSGGQPGLGRGSGGAGGGGNGNGNSLTIHHYYNNDGASSSTNNGSSNHASTTNDGSIYPHHHHHNPHGQPTTNGLVVRRTSINSINNGAPSAPPGFGLGARAESGRSIILAQPQFTYQQGVEQRGREGDGMGRAPLADRQLGMTDPNNPNQRYYWNPSNPGAAPAHPSYNPYGEQDQESSVPYSQWAQRPPAGLNPAGPNHSWSRLPQPVHYVQPQIAPRQAPVPPQNAYRFDFSAPNNRVSASPHAPSTAHGLEINYQTFDHTNAHLLSPRAQAPGQSSPTSRPPLVLHVRSVPPAITPPIPVSAPPSPAYHSDSSTTEVQGTTTLPQQIVDILPPPANVSPLLGATVDAIIAVGAPMEVTSAQDFPIETNATSPLVSSCSVEAAAAPPLVQESAVETDVPAETSSSQVEVTESVRQFMERFSSPADSQALYDPSDVIIYADSDEE